VKNLWERGVAGQTLRGARELIFKAEFQSVRHPSIFTKPDKLVKFGDFSSQGSTPNIRLMFKNKKRDKKNSPYNILGGVAQLLLF